MLIGIDFDNTVVCYDKIFHKIALERGLIPATLPVGKGSVRDYLRGENKEEAWIELQGTVYGSRIKESDPFPGVAEFLTRCKKHGIGVWIISHKTHHPFLGPRWDLHQAAHAWLAHHGFFPPAGSLSPDRVYFELTKEGTLSRIARLGCTHFIDDLPEFLREPAFPPGVKRIWFDPNGNGSADCPFPRADSWRQIERMIFEEGCLS